MPITDTSAGIDAGRPDREGDMRRGGIVALEDHLPGVVGEASPHGHDPEVPDGEADPRPGRVDVEPAPVGHLPGTGSGAGMIGKATLAYRRKQGAHVAPPFIVFALETMQRASL